MQTAPLWIELDGAANARDVGGLPLFDGTLTQPHRLIRTDNLQGLSQEDVRLLVDEYGVRSVVDLRSDIEVNSEGPGPLTFETQVEFLHASLFLEFSKQDGGGQDGGGQDGGADVADTDDGPVILPWHDRPRANGRRAAASIYLSYLTERPDSIIAGLQQIAHGPGATLVHCAAGKDRTGVLVALALSAVGVERTAIVEDYACTAERLPALLARLAASPTYAADITVDDPDRHHPRASTMQEFLATLDREHGGVTSWLSVNGWTEQDQQALRAKLAAP